MRLDAASLLWASLVPSALAILADEAYHIDYHHALLGQPGAANTFFHRSSPSSVASLLYTHSDKNILGAVNPKDGSVVWRQNVTEYFPQAVGSSNEVFLRAADNDDALVSAFGSGVSAWDAIDGRFRWIQRITDGVVKDLELVPDRPEEIMHRHDVLVLSGDKKGVLRRLDIDYGSVVWEYKDER